MNRCALLSVVVLSCGEAVDRPPSFTSHHPEICGNGVDDDGDGAFDEDCACEPGELEACYPGERSAAGVGRCTLGEAVCGPDGWGPCEGAQLPIDERCDDDVDDDCDGAEDDGCPEPRAICPPNFSTEPLVEVRIEATGSDEDGRIVSYLWELVERPEGSGARVDPDDVEDPPFTPDLVGLYTLRLTVTDDDGLTDSCQVDLAAGGRGTRVEMYWNPPDGSCDEFPGSGCDPSDVDLHLLHQDATGWFSDLDCYYLNCPGGLEWDGPAGSDDPRLDLDDVEGFGPENINVDVPPPGATYRVGVHYYSDDGSGPAEVFVNVYCGELSLEPAARFGPVSLPSTDAFWRVADLEWEGTDCTVTPIDPDGDALTTGAAASGAR